jgi:hypothetical protein
VFEQAWEHALGIKPVRSETSYMDDTVWGPLVQPFRPFNFEWRHGETVDEMNRRLTAEVKKFRMSVQANAVLPKGTFQKDNKEITQRHTRWLYHHKIKIKKDTLHKIAWSYHRDRQKQPREHKKPFSSCSCEETVRKGIHNAQALLDHTPDPF